MSTTTIPMRPKRGPRVRESDRGGAAGREAQYDLLTAALIGAAIGASATLLLRRGPGGERPVVPLARGARRAGRGALRAGAAGAEWTWRRGRELREDPHVREIERAVRETVGTASDRIDGLVRAELKALRRSLRRQREALGV